MLVKITNQQVRSTMKKSSVCKYLRERDVNNNETILLTTILLITDDLMIKICQMIATKLLENNYYKYVLIL